MKDEEVKLKQIELSHTGLDLYYETIQWELNRRLIQGVGVMKDKTLKLEETQSSHTLGGTIKYT